MIRLRPFRVPVLAFLLAAGLWGCGGSKGPEAHAPKAWTPPMPSVLNPVLARVGSRAITRSDVDSVLAQAPASIQEEYRTDPDQYQQLVERVAQQEMIYQASLKAGIERDKAYQTDLQNTRRTLLMKHYYQQVVQMLPPLPDSDVRAYYDAHPGEFTMPGRVRVRHILVRTQAKAREVARLLKSASWEQVCARSSTDKATAKSGGVLGFVSSDGAEVPGIGNAPAIVAAAFALKEGETSAPLKSARGWHIIRVDEKTAAGTQPYQVVERQIRGNLEAERSQHFQDALLDSLKKEYGMVVYTDSISNAMKPVLKPSELFAQAQTTESPKDRIELFRRVVTEYPQDKSAVQAAFMIGFTYAEELKDYASARTAFQEFLRKYPSSDLVGSAHWMLDNMEHSVPPPGLAPDSIKIEVSPTKDPGSPNRP